MDLQPPGFVGICRKYVRSHFKQSLDQNVVGRGIYEKKVQYCLMESGELLCGML